MLDTNVWFGRWHKQKFMLDTPDKLQRHLESFGISRAVVSSTDAIFCCDPQQWNDDLSHMLKDYPSFIFAPVFKPTLANREEVIDQYASLPVRVLRLLPGYHTYELSSGDLDSVFRRCSELNYVILVQMRMEDERSHHPLVRIPPVETEDVIKTAKKFPDINFVCLSAYFKEATELCNAAENIYVDISFIERMSTIASLVGEIPVSRVLPGSHTPFLYTASALLKLKYAELSPDQVQLIHENARLLLDV